MDLAALLAAPEKKYLLSDDGDVARDVIRLERGIRRRFVRVAAGAMALSILSIAGLWYAGLVQRIGSASSATSSFQAPDFWDVDLSLSSTTCLSALAILATVIVALQLAVRPGSSLVDGTLAAQVARIRALESLALLAGFAAVATGIYGAQRVGLDSAWTHPLSFFGPVALGALLCAVATDGSTASHSKYGAVVAAEYSRQMRDRYVIAHAKLGYRKLGSARPRLGERGQAMVIAFCVLVLSLAPALAFSDGSPWWRLALGSFLTLGMGVVSAAAAAGLAGHSARLRDFWTTGFVTLLGLAVAGLSILTTAQIALTNVRTNAEAVQVIVLFLLNSLLLALTIAMTSGPPSRWFAPGISRRLSDQAYLNKLRPRPLPASAEMSPGTYWSLASVATGIGIVLCGLIPPLGLLWASRILISGQRGAKRTCALVSISLAVALIIGSVIVGAAADTLFPATNR
jgi:hypothetical protein